MRPSPFPLAIVLLLPLVAASGIGPDVADDAASDAAPAVGASKVPSLVAALDALGHAVGAPLSPADADRVAALEQRLAPEASAAIAGLASALAKASLARPLGAAPPGGDPAGLAAAAASVGGAAESVSVALRGLLAEDGCLLDCPKPSIDAACLPPAGCLPPPGLLPEPCVPPPGLEPDCGPACPPGQGGAPPACLGPCPPGSVGLPPACQPPPPPPPPPPVPPMPAACAAAAGLAAPFTVAPLLSLGTNAAEGYGLDVVLSIDSGGDDAYCNNAGSTLSAGPPHNVLGVKRCSEFAPAAVLLDLGGNDAYHSVYKGIAETDAVPRFCFEGSSDAGVAWFQDAAGDDAYNSGHLIHDTGIGAFGCQALRQGEPTIAVPVAYYDATLNQGATVSGFGFLEDLDGDDAYNSKNIACTRYQGGVCMRIHVAQGAAHAPTGQGEMRERLGNDLYNSRNEVRGTARGQFVNATGDPAPCPPSGDDAWMLIRDVQGAALQGVGDLRDGGGADAYNVGNQVVGDWQQPQPGRPARLLVECAQGCGILGGQGRHHDGGEGGDSYNSGNVVDANNAPAGGFLGIRCVQGVTATGVPFTGELLAAALGEAHCVSLPEACTLDCGDCATGLGCPPEALVFPSTPETTRGALEDAGGADSYNSDNAAKADSLARLLVLQAQGSSEGGDGRLVERKGADRLNADNSATAADPGSAAVLAIEAVQGNVRSLLGAGTLLSDEGLNPDGLGNDRYNSGNTAAALGPDRVRITYAQAASSAPPGSLALARLHERAGNDQYNTGNAADLVQVLGTLAAVGKSPALLRGGSVDYADDAGGDAYNTGNGAACAAGAGACVDWSGCVFAGAGPSWIRFLDQRLAGGVDAWNPAPASYGFGRYNSGLSGAGDCVDRLDGLDVPLPNGFLDS
jgi:hypothetical protein